MQTFIYGIPVLQIKQALRLGNSKKVENPFASAIRFERRNILRVCQSRENSNKNGVPVPKRKSQNEKLSDSIKQLNTLFVTSETYSVC